MTSLQESPRFTRVLALIVGLGMVVPFLFALWASNSQLALPRLEIVFFLAEESTSEIFFSDEYGNFSPDGSLTLSSSSGVNRAEVSLADSFRKGSFAYRFDPCSCNTPIVMAEVSLTSAFGSTSIPPHSWVVGGSSTLDAEGTYVVLQDSSASADPQVIIFPDLPSRLAELKAQTFWAVFGLSFFSALGVIALMGAIVLRRANRKGSSAVQVDSPRRTRRSLQPPVWLLVLTVGVGLVGVTQQFLGAIFSGVTIDEPLHVEHLSRFFESGTYSSDAYGPVTAVFGHTVNSLLGFEAWGVPNTSADAYVVRHLAIAVLGLLTAIAVAVISRVVMGNWGWAIVSVGLLYSFPLWVGHTMFNIKDAPLAAGFTMFTAGLALLVSEVSHRSSRVIAGSLLLTAGFVVGVGTRPVGLLLMVGSLVVLGLFWGVPRAWNLMKSSLFTRLVGLTLTGMILVVAMVLAQMASASDFLLTNFEYPWNGWNLYGGDRVESRPGLRVVLAVLAASTPLLLGALGLVGLVGLGERLSRKSSGDSARSAERVTIALTAYQGLGAFLAILLVNPVLYDNARQILFVVPALAVIVTVGLYSLVASLRKMTSLQKGSEVIVGLVVAFGLVAPMVNQVQLFPYNYSFYNVVAQGAGVNGSWETDYWGSSIREAAEVVAPGDPVTCRSVGDLNFNIASLEPCATLAPYVGDFAVAKDSTLKENHFWVIRSERTLLWNGPVTSDNCEFHSQVTRPLRGEDVSMAWVYQCEDR